MSDVGAIDATTIFLKHPMFLFEEVFFATVSFVVPKTDEPGL